jgi:hypothetical protein
METTAEIIQFKQNILREAPYSAGKIKDQDKIFYLKEPGVDATLTGTSTSATAVFRVGWGTSPRPTRYGGLLAADRDLRSKGYRPYNIFSGNEYTTYETKHKLAAKERENRQSVFMPIETKKVKLDKTSGQFIGGVIQQPGQGMYIPDIQVPSETEIVKDSPKLTYAKLGPLFEDPIRDLEVINRGYYNNIMTPNDFGAFAKRGYSGVMGMEAQLGLRGYASPQNYYKSNKKGGKSGKKK